MKRKSKRGKKQKNGDARWDSQEDSYRPGQMKTNMNNEKSSEIFIDNSFVGKIIGKGGSKIRELQAQSGTHINVLKNDPGAAKTSIIITGTSEAIDEAKTLIENLTSAALNAPEEDSYLTGKEMVNVNNKSFEIFIDDSFVGRVIGKGGSKIRELQDESKALIQILKNDYNATETSVIITGTTEAIEKAKSLIENLMPGALSSLENSYHSDKRMMNVDNEKSSEIFIDNIFVGKIIGKEGSKIRELQDESKARINVLKNDSSAVETCVVITGTPEAIDKAKTLIENLTSDALNYIESSYGSGERMINVNNEKYSEIFIDNSLVGKVIGKGGSKIKELQDESNACIEVFTNNSGFAMTSVRLTGTSEAIEKAKTLIENLTDCALYLHVQNNWICEEPSNYMQPFDNEAFSSTGLLAKNDGASIEEMKSGTSSEIFINSSFVGKVIGKGGSKIRELENESNACIKVSRNNASSAGTSIELIGTPEAIEKAKSLIKDLISDTPNSSGGNHYHTNRRINMNKEQSSHIYIDNSLVGKVIGKGGSKIRELQDESNTYITVLENNSGAAETPIKLSGTPEAIERAKSLINDLISDVSNLSLQSDYNKFSSSYLQPSERQCFDWAELLEKNEEARLIKCASLPPIIKNFYKEESEVASMRPEDAEKFRQENNCISVTKVDFYDIRRVPNPITSFKQAFHNYPELLDELRKQGFSTPSPIQSQAWPIILQGYDMIGVAQTGTGKTITFLLPALIHITGQVTHKGERVGPTALILAPTRELAQQIETEAKMYHYKGIKSICVYGGSNRRNQINRIAKGVDMIIATPGRLNDLCMNGNVDVSGVTYLVIDEADRMLDMGFEPQIRTIIADTREDRQTIMTSATWNDTIQELATRCMTKPFKVNIGAFDLAAVHSVSQEIIFCEDDYNERLKILDEFIKTMSPDDKAIVFVETKAIADNIANDLNLKGTAVQSIHGDKEQWYREQALKDLRAGHVKILIATDVASRGIDIKDITVVFNLFFPRNIEEYVHRVGRTGRAGRSGRAISVVTRRDWNHVVDLIKILEEAEQHVPDELYDIANYYTARKDKNMAESRRCITRRAGRYQRNRY